MAIYLTPFGRVARRRAWSQPQPYQAEEEWNAGESEVAIPVNVKAEADGFVITALLPGLTADEVSVQVINETVTIQGELKDGVAEGEQYLLRERPAGRFYRVLRLPEALDAAQAQAELNEGVLTLRVPKAEAARPRVIKIGNKN